MASHDYFLEDLAELIAKACGGKDGPLVQFKEHEAKKAKIYNTSTAMPFDDPAAFAVRRAGVQLHRQVRERNSQLMRATGCLTRWKIRRVPNARTNVLVVGSLGSRRLGAHELWKED